MLVVNNRLKLFLKIKNIFLLCLQSLQNTEGQALSPKVAAEKPNVGGEAIEGLIMPKGLALSPKVAAEKPNVGGQAVIEGVMMRGPEAWAVALRRNSGEVEVRYEKYLPWSKKYPILAKPFLRGAVVLLESMVLGLKALNFSAEIAAKDEQAQENLKKEAENNSFIAEKEVLNQETPAFGFWSIALALGSAFGLAMLLFVALPHILAALMGNLVGFGDTSPLFHLIDGLIKFIFFLLYVGLIGLIPDIKRVYAYHGAEHQAIYTYENGEELLVSNAKKHKAWHPRCGTAFIFLVLAISIIFFAAIFPYIFSSEGGGVLRATLGILIKISLMFPLAGMAYEVTRLAGKAKDNSFWRYLLWPGLLMQRLTTRKPDESQLEIAIISLKKALNLN